MINSQAEWRNGGQPAAAGPETPGEAARPKLGPGFELAPEAPLRHCGISRIHPFGNAAIPSLEPVRNGLAGMKAGVARELTAAPCAERSDDFADASAACDRRHFDPRGAGENDKERT